MSRKLCLAACAVLWSAAAWSAPQPDRPITAVAAENFYGDVARQIGGPDVNVISILNSPDQDPHEFEASPSTARALSGARIVIYNGADYDPWMEKLLAGSKSGRRDVIVVANLMGKKTGDNPHLWYDPATMPAVASKIAAALEAVDPAHGDEYRLRLKTFVESLEPVAAKINTIKAKHQGIPVTATEPVFGYMAKALGFEMRNERFQLSVMNDAEPRPSDVAAMQNDLKGGKVKLLFYNSQVSSGMTKRMLALAKAGKVPVVGITETAPPHKSYQEWITGELDAVEKALGGSGL